MAAAAAAERAAADSTAEAASNTCAFRAPNKHFFTRAWVNTRVPSWRDKFERRPSLQILLEPSPRERIRTRKCTRGVGHVKAKLQAPPLGQGQCDLTSLWSDQIHCNLQIPRATPADERLG